MKKKMKDLSGDGKITKKDVLMGRGVIARKSGGMAKGSREGSVIKAKKGTHVTKDGRTVKKGLYYNMNKAKKDGTSKPGKGSVTDKALKQSAKTAFKPKNKKA
jgi:hypothetical protein|tara:strand:+ start:439 stop:747 length:309 start_codon:yes stop_codon:yes gene_type:complete